VTERHHILVVDDEPQITRVLRTALTAHGYDVRVAHDGESALEMMKDWRADLVVTDLAMPNVDGVELCRRIRQKSEIPIIVLSVRDQEKTKIEALDAGADDYVTKPFSVDELMARVRANLRRLKEVSAGQTLIEDGDFRIDLDAHSVTVSSREVRLTPKEFDLLVYLAQHPRKVITTRKLLAAVWGANSIEQPEYVRVFVNHLRKKLERDPENPRYILNDPWIGYRFDPGE
jgi:two-component system, OmpR family, KDP operon response regulator KdpE